MSALDAAAPKLLIRSIFGARVLQLARTPRPLEVEDFDESAPFVNADETPDLELFWPAGSDDGKKTARQFFCSAVFLFATTKRKGD